MSDMPTTFAPPTVKRYSSRRLLGLLAVLVAGIGLLKFLGLLVDLGPAQAPWGFLLVFVVPLLVGTLLLPARPRVGAAVIGVVAAVMGVGCAVVILQGAIEAYWGDYLLVFVGGPLAWTAAAVAVRVLRGR